MFTDIDINYWEVLVAAVAHMILGALWYSPLLFGKIWMAESGLTQANMKSDKMPQRYIMAFVGTLVTAFVFAHFIEYTGASTVGEGMQTAFWIWLGFFVTAALAGVLWEGKTLKLYLINIGYYLAALLAMGAIMAAWN